MRRILGAWPRKTAFALLIAAWSGSARPEVTLDGSLGGPSGSLPGPDFQIDANVGRQVGSNLFHSFGVFNVNTGESATFNDVGTSGLIENILSRVTGGSASNIDGRLRTDFANATPNLFLLNPAGVVFGQNASLDVQGSFHVSTADFIELADGVRFDALPSSNDALLTTAPPVAFGFLREQPAAIAFRGSGSESGFSVPEDETLSVIGGDVEITSAAMLKAPGGRINLASLASAGKVKLGNAALEAESSGPLGTITAQGSTFDVSERQGGTTGGGSVFIRGERFVADNSKVLANTVNSNSGDIDIKLTGAMRVTNESSFEARTSGPGKGGDVDIQAKEILLEGSSKLETCSAPGGCADNLLSVCQNCGDAGDIAINTGRLQLTGGSRINANTQTPGNAGNVTINATDEVVLADDSQVNTAARLRKEEGRPRPAVLGNAGSIVINTGRLELNKGGMSTLTSGNGRAGDVKITAKEVLLKGSFERSGSFLLATTDTGNGKGGEITINTDRLSLTEGATIRTRSNGPGKGGDITIEANNIVLEGKSMLLAEAFGTAGICGQDCGDGGNVSIKTGRLQLTGESKIDVLTQGDGNAGNVTINATEEMVLADGSQVLTSARNGGLRILGNAGNIVINTGRLELNRGGMWALTSGDGRAGDVKITAKEVLLKGRFPRAGSFLLATTDTGSGEGGEITINTDRLSLAEGATIRARTNGPGKGGDITIEANDIVLEGGSELEASSYRRATNDAGNITIHAGRLELKNGASIRAETFGPGAGGAIDIYAINIDILDGSRVSSESTSEALNAGASGGVRIRARESLRLFNDSQITVETAQADAGDITLEVGFLLHLRDNSSITTSVAGGEGRGGNIRIDPVFVVLDNSDIIANARQGQAGSIRIVSDFFFASPDSIVRASNDRNIQGVVDIESPDTDLNAGLVELPADFFDVATLLTQGCTPGADLSRLVVRKYEVLPDSPAALRVPPPGGLLKADDQNAFTGEPPWPNVEQPSACDGNR